MMGIPTREEKKAATKASRERLAGGHRAALEAKRAAKRERRRQLQAFFSRQYRVLYPEKKRESDRRYRAANADKVAEAKRLRKVRAKLRGYRWYLTPKHIDEKRAASAAVAYLRSVGLMEWGSIRPDVALAYVREQGLL
jgi:hypothetical protein